ncbi:uncharacterized protein LOC114357481 [Ostrinia furnacalis]|uniref:uncharacterized protein LOC114357481 n=1 Tax=Ostrinia furnacalis TaxID=93504 RepID=UPI00103D04A7|nr:uncharacterized protein LOC114357481 [Ostrinia furnacalis]
MGLLAILGLLLVITKSSMEISSEYLENDNDNRLINNVRIHKREAKPSRRKNNESDNKDFIEEKLVAHGQALEHLVTMVQKNEELTRKLVEKLSALKTVEEPEMPEKVEVHNTRRSYVVDDDEQKQNVAENPFTRLARNLPKYGLLLKDLVLARDASADPLSGRRSFGKVDTPVIRGETGNQWCIAAFLCRSDNDKVCGFDSSYGYGRFKDICHMFDVNCYWKYNFLLSHACDQFF